MSWYTLLQKPEVIIIAVLVIIIILAFIADKLFGKKFTDNIIQFITKAQYGKLASNVVADKIAKFRAGTMDDRMVLVIAEAINKIPVVNIIYIIFPKQLVVNWLYNKTQKIFDSVEVALKGQRRFGSVEEIVSEVLELNSFKLSDEDVDRLKDIIGKNIEETLPKYLGDAEDLKELIELVRTNLPLLKELRPLQNVLAEANEKTEK